MSDDLEQDNPWVQHMLEIILRTSLPDVLQRAGAQPMYTVIVFSDNCCPQFKNLYDFYFIGGKNISDSKANVPRLHLQWHFWAACHGKNVSDSEGATIKKRNKRRGKRRSLEGVDFTSIVRPMLNFRVAI